MAKNKAIDPIDRWITRILLGLNLLFVLCGTAIALAGLWSLVDFDSCRKTFVCDKDVIPPIILLAFGLGIAIASNVILPQHNWALENNLKALRNLTLAVGVVIMTLGLGLGAFSAYQWLTNASSGLGYYQWLQKQGSQALVTDIIANGVVVATAGYLLRPYHRLSVSLQRIKLEA